MLFSSLTSASPSPPQRLFFLAMRGQRALHEWESSRPLGWMVLSSSLSLPLSHRFLLPSSSFHLFRRSIGKFEIIAVPCELHPSVFTLFEEFGKTFSNFPRHMYVDTLWITYSQIVLQNIDYYIKINCKLGYHGCFLPFFFHRHIWRFNFSVTQWYLLWNNLFMTILNLLIIVYSC